MSSVLERLKRTISNANPMKLDREATLLAQEKKLEKQIAELAAQRRPLQDVVPAVNTTALKQELRDYAPSLVAFVLGETKLNDDQLRKGIAFLLKERFADEMRRVVHDRLKPITQREQELDKELAAVRVELRTVQNEILAA